MSKTKILILILAGCVFVASVYLMLNLTARGDPIDVRMLARRASVQTVFHVPVLHISFTTPLAEPEKLTPDKVKEMLEEEQKKVVKQINEAVEKYSEEQKKDRYETSLTDLEKWGYEPKSKTFIPLGAFAPKWAKFPENILVVCKIEKKEISPWEKEYEDDVLTISETANVSPSQAKTILANIKSKGYSITKEEIKKADEIELLYFSSWTDAYPRTLDWKVTLEGEDNNMIIGYDPRGILEVKPIPDDKKVYVKAGYFDLKDEFKETPTEILNLRKQLETIKGNLETANEEIDRLKKEANKKPESKRDITQATFWDLKLGTIKLEEFYFMTASSGIFLGNMDVRKEMATWAHFRGWGDYSNSINPKKAAVILSNAHVVDQAMTFMFMVDNDKENMWIIFPGAPSIRHTKHSDYYGSPAWVLGINQTPVISTDCDAGILLSTPIPAYEQYKAVLGNSDNVKPGDEIVTVGNPIGMQKFTTQGVISNTNYSMLDSLDGAYFLKYLINNKPAYSWMLNSNFWIDATIGIGGVSGSGVWATEGSETGKVVAIRNMGMITRFSRATSVTPVNIDALDYDKLPDNVAGINKNHFKYLFDSGKPNTGYSQTFDGFLDSYPDFKEVYDKQYGGHMAVAGMNGCIPINYVKTFLQERGLDPAHFKWDGLKDNYWEE